MNARPRTAATTTYFDETRIKDKIDYLDKIEREIDLDIDKILAAPTIIKKKQASVKLNKQMVLDVAMCESLDEVNTLMLRDKGIEYFDDIKGEGGFKLEELCNIECLMASHNLIKDMYGIC
jgi:phage-related protein